MKILKLFIIAVTLFSASLLSSSAEAGKILGEVDYALTEEYATNPDHFFSGSSIGSNAGRTYIKRSLLVEQYNPPYYIISVEKVNVSWPPGANGFQVHEPERVRYYFNWETKKAYYERIYLDSSAEWIEITTNFRNEKGIANDIFKLAYNMDFFSPAELK